MYQSLIIIQQNAFSENVLAIEIKNIKVKMNKPVSLGLSILEISKTCMNFSLIILNQSIRTINFSYFGILYKFEVWQGSLAVI